jgi:hypothetical protein
MIFDFEEHVSAISDWIILYKNVEMLLSDGAERAITSPLFTMVRTEPHVFKKSQIKAIRSVDGYFTGKHLEVRIENEDGESWIKIYPQFELKTEGKIKDIVLILMFIKTEIETKASVVAEETII